RLRSREASGRRRVSPTPNRVWSATKARKRNSSSAWSYLGIRVGCPDQFTERLLRGENELMQQVYRFGPTPEQPARHLFVFLHASGADARSMIPAAFKYQGRFPSAALVVPSGFFLYGNEPEAKQWFSTKNLSSENYMARVSAILPRIEQLVRRE